MQVSGPVYSNILFCPAPISVLLHIYQQCSIYSDHFIITWSDLSASPHAKAMSCVLLHFILSCSDLSVSAHPSVMPYVLWLFYYLLLRPQCFSTCKSHVLCTPTSYSLLLWLKCFCTSINNVPCTPIKFHYFLLQPQCFSTCMSHVLCALTFYFLLLWS